MFVLILGIYLSTKSCIFVKGRYFIHFFKHTLSIIAYNFKIRFLINKMIKLQHKICIRNVMNCLIQRQIENSVLKSGADNHYRFPEFSSGRLASNKWNGL